MEAQRTEVELEIADELNERNELVLKPFEDRVDEARHDLAVAELESAQIELDLPEPAPERRADERVLLVLLDREHLEAADASVRPDADLQVQRGEPLVVAKEIGERAIRFALLHAAPERREARQARARRHEALGRAVDDLLHELQDVELAAVRVPLPGAGGALE